MLSGSAQNARLLTVPGSSLLLLSGDKTDEQPQRLLDCDKMCRLMALLRTKLDYVIIDSPPAGILSDAATIASSVDAALYVVRQDLASAGQIQDSIQALAAGGVDLLGCVLNCTPAGTTRRGDGGREGVSCAGSQKPCEASAFSDYNVWNTLFYESRRRRQKIMK